MKKAWLVLALFLGLTGTARAGIMIEPYIGYEMGKISGSDGIEGKTSMTSVGGRLAWRAPVMLWAGVDMTAGMSGKYTDDNGGPDFDMKRSTTYAVVGIDLPILLRGWVGYGFTSNLSIDTANDFKTEGSATKAGIGFTGLPFVSVNFEYIKDSINKIKRKNGDIDSPSTDHSSYMLSVSLPLNF